MKELITITSTAMLILAGDLPVLADTGDCADKGASTNKIHGLKAFHHDKNKARLADRSTTTEENAAPDDQTSTPANSNSLDYGSDSFIITGG